MTTAFGTAYACIHDKVRALRGDPRAATLHPDVDVAWLIALALGLGAGGWWLARRRRRGARPHRADEAAQLRDRLIARVKDPNVADRLAEDELQREPSADMATCYQRALHKLERDKAR